MSKLKKMLTLDDLVKFCKKENFYSFNSQDTGYQLAVQIPSYFDLSSDYTDNTLLFCNVKLFHIGENRNHSSVTKDAAIKSLSTIAYKPLLANFCEIDGVKDFTSHDMIIDENGDVEYIERQIGCFTSDMPEIRYDEETDKEFVFARVAIPREYTDACDIIERKNGTKISVELLINEMQYSVKNNVLELTDVVVSGATCLGKNPETGEDVSEGMKGARLAIEDFSNKENSIVDRIDYSTQNKLIETLEKLNMTLESFSNKTNSEKGGEKVMEKFEELLAKYGKTADEVTFEYENLSDEELEVAFKEAFGEAEAEVDSEAETEVTDEGEHTDEDVVVEEAETETDTDDAADDEVEVVETVPVEEGFTLQYKLSHDDIRSALYSLLAAASEDGYYYTWIVEVYDNEFIYQDYLEDKFYRQNYSKDGDNVSLGESKVEVFNEWLSKEERDALETLKADYAALKSFKENYEADKLKAEKDAIFSREEYSVIADNEEFKALVSEAVKYSVEEIESKVKSIFADHVIKTGTFSAKNDAETKVKTIGFNFNEKPSKKKQAYGGLFAKDE